MKIQQLQEAGFSQDEIAAHVSQKRLDWLRAGFSEDEINSYLGINEVDKKPIEDTVQTYISQDEPDSFWDNFLKAFEPSWAEKRARSYKSLVAAEKAHISPSKFEPTLKESITQGYQQSVTGLIQRGKLPDNQIPAAAMKYLPTSQRLAMQTATLAGDAPYMAMGAILGGVSGGPAAPLTAMGGAFALPAGLRKVYVDMYQKGQISSWSEFWQRTGDAVMETLKAEAVGVGTAAAGAGVPGAIGYAAEVGAMTTLGAAMQGTVPEPQDFYDAALLIGGFRASKLVSSRLMSVYADTGEHPYSILKRLKKDPKLQEELVSTNLDPVVSAVVKDTEGKAWEAPTHHLALAELEAAGKQFDPLQADLFKTKSGRILDRETASELTGDPTMDATGIVGKPTKKYSDAQQEILDTISVGEGKKRRSASETLNDLYTNTIDDLHPLNQVVRQMLRGEKIDAAKDPYKLARLFRGVKGLADHFIDKSPIDFNTKQDLGKPLRDILQPFKNDLNGLRAYAKSKRAIELNKRGIESGVPIDAAKEVVKAGEKTYEKTFAELKEYQDHVLNYLYDSGLVSKKTLNKIRDLNQDYVPFYRVMESKPRGAGKGLESYDPLKAIKGSELKTVDPLESIIKNTYLFVTLAEKNRIGSTLVDLAKQKDGLGQFVKKIKKPIRPIKVTKEEAQKAISSKETLESLEDFTIFRPTAFSPKENQIRVWMKGRDQLFEVHPDIARVFKSLDSESMNLFVRIFSVPAKWLRAGAILSPEFIARNPLRDTLSAFVFSKWGFTPAVDFVKGISSVLKKDQFYWDWQKSGGTMAEITALDRKYLQKDIGRVVAKYPVLNRIKYGANPIELFRVMSELSEQGTRIGEFRRARKKGASIEEAGFASREITLDFQRIGAKTRAVNSMVAFWNANLQGADKLARSFKDNPLGTTAKIATGITIPSLLLVASNHNDGRWDDIPRWQRDLFWIVMPNHISKEKWNAMSAVEQAEFNKNNHIWRIPKPFELGIIFGTVPERFLEAYLEENPEELGNVLETLGRGASPGLVPTAAIPVVENWANRSLFLDRPLIPAQMEGILPEYQYKNYTTEAAIAIGKLLGKLPALEENPNISPIKVENMIRGWSGGLGFHVLKIASWGLKTLQIVPENVKPADTFSDWPVIKAFHVRNPSSGAESVNNFYNSYFSAKKRFDTFKYLVKKRLNPQEALRVITGREADIIKIDSIYKAISQAHQALNLIHNHPEMSRDEKRQLIDVTYFQMIKMAKAGNKALKKVREELNKEK